MQAFDSGGGGINNGVTDPSSFRREMTRFAPKFSGYDQHDSQEFLQYALEGLHNELNRVAKKKQPSNCDADSAAPAPPLPPLPVNINLAAFYRTAF